MSFFDSVLNDPRKLAGAQLGMGLMQMGMKRPVGTPAPGGGIMPLLMQYLKARKAGGPNIDTSKFGPVGGAVLPGDKGVLPAQSTGLVPVQQPMVNLGMPGAIPYPNISPRGGY